MPSFSNLLAVAAALAPVALAQTGVYSNVYGVYTVTQDTGADVPLASKKFEWPHLPYQADTGDSARGTQQGYNLCNATTQNQQSMCQTAYVNAVDDFCLWGSPTVNETVANVEEEMVAFCTKKRYGTRLLPQGAIQGVQFIRTPDYVEIVGMIDQTALNLQSDDSGGEEDPHGADERGNPLGSLMYSSAFNTKDATTGNYSQVFEWDYFVGGGIFCMKVCDSASPNAAQLCQHTYDRVGCTYNSPANYAAVNGTFQSCQGDNQTPVGVYVSNGVTTTWVQPPESLGVISSIPYTPSVPATSSCSTFTSSAIYTELLAISTAAPSASAHGSTKGGSAAASSKTTASGAGASSSGKPSSGAVPRTVNAGVGFGAIFSVVVAAGISALMVMVA